MKQRLISQYGYETHFNGASLTLRPGLNLIDRGDYDAALRDTRFRQVIAVGRVVDSGRHVDWLKELVTKTPEDVTIADVKALGVDDAQALVRALGRNTEAIRVLSGLAERGGVKTVFATALEGRG